MSSHNFWDSFTHGFMHGMYASNPFLGFGCGPVFGCGWNFMSVWSVPCFMPFNGASLFLTPNIMNTNTFPLLQETPLPSFNIKFEMPKQDYSEMWNNFWEAQRQYTERQERMMDTFERKTTRSDESEDKERPENKREVVSEPYVRGSNGTRTSAGDYSAGLENQKLTDRYTGSAEQLNQILNKKDGVLKNKGNVFLQAQEKYGINAAILAAICINESGYGTSNLARTKNNVGGVSEGMGFKSYNSVDECIMDMARFLKSGYVDKGIVTISDVGAKYCPVSDPRDTKGINAKWPRNICAITRSIEALA